MDNQNYNLDYLFIAETLDGSIIKQTPDDKPRFSSWGTLMTDVQKEHLRKFSLVGKGHMFTVDLKDGHIEVDGNKIHPVKRILPGAVLKPIYWREVSRDIVVGLGGKVLPPKIRYILGWQYNLNGKNYDWQMGIE